VILTSAADPLEINPQTTPIGPWLSESKTIDLPAIPGQKWQYKGVTATDISRRFVLIDPNGTVRPVVGGRLGDPLSLPPASLERPFFKIGELRGSPILLNNAHQLTWWSPLAREWRSLGLEGILGDQFVNSAGEDWISVVVNRGTADCTPKLLTFDTGIPYKLRLLGSSQFKVPIRQISGTASDPLVIDVYGHVWGLKPGGASKPWTAENVETTMLWEKREECPPNVGAVNALGVFGVLGSGPDRYVFRYSGGKWENLGVPTDAPIQTIGGTWRNPMLLSVARPSVGWGLNFPVYLLYRLEDPS
jgi:hypothetical protein